MFFCCTAGDWDKTPSSLQKELVSTIVHAIANGSILDFGMAWKAVLKGPLKAAKQKLLSSFQADDPPIRKICDEGGSALPFNRKQNGKIPKDEDIKKWFRELFTPKTSQSP